MTKVYSIYDSKAETFNQPFFAEAKGLALRMFTDLVNDPKSTVSRYPADFTLFELGEYDLHAGHLLPHASKVNLGCALEFVSQDESPIARVKNSLEKYEKNQQNKPM